MSFAPALSSRVRKLETAVAAIATGAAVRMPSEVVGAARKRELARQSWLLSLGADERALAEAEALVLRVEHDLQMLHAPHQPAGQPIGAPGYWRRLTQAVSKQRARTHLAAMKALSAADLTMPECIPGRPFPRAEDIAAAHRQQWLREQARAFLAAKDLLADARTVPQFTEAAGVAGVASPGQSATTHEGNP